MALQIQLDSALAQLQQGRVDEAIRLYTQILGRERNQPDALYMLGAIAFRLGQIEQALEFAEAVTTCAPQQARGWALKGLSLRALRRAEEALAAARKAIALDPNLAEAWECAGTALMQYGRWREARAHFEQALARFPDHANLRGAYALALGEEGDFAAAYRECRMALAGDPACTPALLAETTLLANAGYYDRALTCARAAVARASVQKPFAYGLGALALIAGRFEEGYALLAADRPAHGPAASLPEWSGASDAAMHVMLFGEQGYGDTLQFIRFAGRVAQKVRCVTARVPAQLERLLRFSMPDLPLSVYQPLTTGARRPMHEIDPVFDFPSEANARCSFLGLPCALRLGADTGAERVPYLHADPAIAAAWRERLATVKHPRIALVWAGSPQHGNDHNRSLAFEAIKPLVEKFRSHIVSMQIGPEATGAARAGVFDATPLIKDFADSAALLENIDVLITADTAPAHLAGGMGKPVWLMLPFNPDWRWLIGREDSPWYPAMRLFRQPQPKDWTSVVQKLSAGLDRLVAGDRRVLQPERWTGEMLDRHPHAVPLPTAEGLEIF